MDKIILAEQLQRIALQNQAITDAATLLQELGSFESAITHTKNTLGKLKSEVDVVSVELARARAERDAVIQGLDREIDDKRRQADMITAKAKQDAEARIANAEARIGEMLARAESDAAAKQAQATSKLAAVREELATLEGKCADTERLIEARTEELTAVEAQLAKIRESIRSITEGV